MINIKEKKLFLDFIETVEKNNLFKARDYAEATNVLKKISMQQKNYYLVGDFRSIYAMEAAISISKSIKRIDEGIPTIGTDDLKTLVDELKQIQEISKNINDILKNKG